MRINKAFTLAEVMIVLTVIGIISAIIMPIAMQSIPKKEIMLFKKGHETLYQVISILINSDKYYKDSNLGIKPDGTFVDGTHTNDNKYFCQTFADNVTAKSVDCKDVQGGTGYFGEVSYVPADVTEVFTLEYAQEQTDRQCKDAQSTVGAEIITSDGIIYYEVNPVAPFKIETTSFMTKQGVASLVSTERYYFEHHAKDGVRKTADGFYYVYRTFCMDIDGIGKGEDPFGYGIRIDGKILNGARAAVWLDKGLSDE